MIYPKVSIIILNWNGKEDTIECLESLKQITYSNYEIILVDNGSTDGSVEVLKKQYPEIEIIENSQNLGYAEGNNVGIRKAIEKNVDYILLLNNDTIVSPEFLEELVKVAEGNSKIGIVGPKICYYSNPNKIWAIGGKINLFTGSIGNYGDGQDENKYKGIKVVDYVSGCALLFKSEVVKKVGLLDKEYFLYFEETDWNCRARKMGYISVINCNTQILHKSGTSVKKIKDSNYYYFPRNTLLFLEKNGNWYHYLTFSPMFLMRYGSIFAFNLLKGNNIRCTNILNGIRDYIKKEYGRYNVK